MIDQIIERVGRAKTVSCVTLSTSTDASDDPLAEHARSLGIPCGRASVDDIIGRMLAGSRLAPSKFVVRVWGDCPFVDPGTIDEMVQRAEREELDFISNGLPGNRTFPPGLDVEVYRTTLLERMTAEVTDPFLREFPFDFVRERAADLRIANHHLSPSRAGWHFTVDYPEDLVAANRLYAAMATSSFTFSELVAACDNDPSLVEAFAGRSRNADYAKKAEARQ